MRIVLAFDKFKGTATAHELGQAVAAALPRDLAVTVVPLADGGEGSLDALGGANKSSTVTGPLGNPVQAGWRLDGKVATIEMAQAAGLTLVGGPQANDPLQAATTGVGELLNKALALGAQKVQVFLGGSATTDGGWPALEAVTSPSRLQATELIVATDVTTRFLDAADVFGPQKGASATQVAFLRRRLHSVAEIYRQRYHTDVTAVPGGGAAGGLAGGLVAVGGRIEAGFEVVAGHVGLDQALSQADLVITGEGWLDAESFNGKVVGGVWQWAQDFNVPVVAIAGGVAPDVELPAGIEALSLADTYGLDQAVANPLTLAAELAQDWVRQSLA